MAPQFYFVDAIVTFLFIICFSFLKKNAGAGAPPTVVLVFITHIVFVDTQTPEAVPPAHFSTFGVVWDGFGMAWDGLGWS